MIVVQSNSGRRLAGNLGGGVDLFDGLRAVCKNHGIRTAELRGIGYLRRIRLATYDADTDRFTEDETPTPQAQCLSLLGNISSSAAGPSFHLQAMLAIQRPEGMQELRGGRVVSADVVDIEFFLVALDDFGLVRGTDGGGISPWIQIEAHGPDVPPQSPPVDPRVSRVGGRPDLVGGRLAPRPEEGEPTYEIRVSDVLEHPKLGSCLITEVKDDDRVVAEFDSGPARELRLSLFKLTQTRTDNLGRRYFAVEMRRKT